MKKDFEDKPDDLKDPVHCDCGKWMEREDGHKCGEKIRCRECAKEFASLMIKPKRRKKIIS